MRTPLHSFTTAPSEDDQGNSLQLHCGLSVIDFDIGQDIVVPYYTMESHPIVWRRTKPKKYVGKVDLADVKHTGKINELHTTTVNSQAQRFNAIEGT